MRALLGVSVTLLAVVLTGCAGAPSSGQPTSTSPSAATPSTSSEPAVPETTPPAPEPAAYTIPTDCASLISSTPFTTTFGSWPLNDPGVVGTPGEPYYTPTGAISPTPAPSGASALDSLLSATELRCIWRDPQADITNLVIEIGEADPGVTDAYMQSLPAEGFTCTSDDHAETCTMFSVETKYNVEVGNTVLVRDGVFIRVSQANISTPDLLDTLVSDVWK
ncbi:hypothetical protein SAMN06295879_0879 [Agreia bicolorata]|uniref:DUF3558 domain-containing protein n=1 Tax=Agreia bicolorata TaxID=110935 RepID=A0A1T4X9A9_9MICO|nr:hypothetical protein [Agreia bicolorata]SKA86143.1 hypothetical protein SAMN06295879_0879 [Agreia bicolorata]